MTNTKRYQLSVDNPLVPYEDAEGEWVRWEDYERLQKHNDDLLRLSERRAYRTIEPSAEAMADRNYCAGAQQALAIAHQSMEAAEKWLAEGCGQRRAAIVQGADFVRRLGGPCVWRTGCQDTKRCTEAQRCLQISKKGQTLDDWVENGSPQKSSERSPCPTCGVMIGTGPTDQHFCRGERT